MVTRKITLATGELYHVYNRGNSKQIIFRDTEDKRHFVKLLALLNQKTNIRVNEISLDDAFSEKNNTVPLVAVGAYVLMDNHFHILLKQLDEEGVSTFMQKLGTAYVMYFNKKYTRSGSLFEGTFKSQHVDDDTYLHYLYAYIHLNPAKMVDKEWKQNNVIKRQDVVDFIKKYLIQVFMITVEYYAKKIIFLIKAHFLYTGIQVKSLLNRYFHGSTLSHITRGNLVLQGYPL